MEPPDRFVFQLFRCNIFPVRIPPNGVISFKSFGADNFCIAEEGRLSAAVDCNSLKLPVPLPVRIKDTGYSSAGAGVGFKLPVPVQRGSIELLIRF